MPNVAATCKHEGCGKPADGGKGYCRRHYAAWRRGELPKARYKTCQAEGCRKRAFRRGRCEEHFARDYPGKKGAAAAKSEGAAAG